MLNGDKEILIVFHLLLNCITRKEMSLMNYYYNIS